MLKYTFKLKGFEALSKIYYLPTNLNFVNCLNNNKRICIANLQRNNL